MSQATSKRFSKNQPQADQKVPQKIRAFGSFCSNPLLLGCFHSRHIPKGSTRARWTPMENSSGKCRRVDVSLARSVEGDAEWKMHDAQRMRAHYLRRKREIFCRFFAGVALSPEKRHLQIKFNFFSREKTFSKSFEFFAAVVCSPQRWSIHVATGASQA